MRLGIGIVTYNRRGLALEAIAAVRAHTRRPFELVVADDGSADGTAEAVRALGVPLVTGENRGVAWNKNRALFCLFALRGCDVVILLEDDTRPVADGWEEEWIAATAAHGHVNYAGEWLQETFVSGAGTAADPVLGRNLTAQCAAFSRQAIAYVGYMDTRFRGFGFEHVEHSHRLARAGYGVLPNPAGEDPPELHVLIDRGLQAIGVERSGDAADIPRNEALFHALGDEPLFRPPWQGDAELAVLHAEMQAVQPAPPLRSLHAPPPPPLGGRVRAELLARLYRGADPLAAVARGRWRPDLSGWNSEHPFLAAAIAARSPSVALEVGVWKGASTITMARAMQALGLDAAIIAVDTWLGSWDHWLDDRWFRELGLEHGRPTLYHTFLANIAEAGLGGYVVPLPVDSANAAEILARRQIRPGVIHIDTGHDYAAVTAELERWWPLLLPGGVMIFDDYLTDGVTWPDVRRAVDDFLRRTPHGAFQVQPPKALTIKPG